MRTRPAGRGLASSRTGTTALKRSATNSPRTWLDDFAGGFSGRPAGTTAKRLVPHIYHSPITARARTFAMRTRLAVLLLGTLSMPAFSDEGMWLLNDPPRQRLQEKYGFDLTDQWLEHARLASVRFNNGGSGSFVSPNGLLITNHHIPPDSLPKLSTADRDLFRAGFPA